MARSPRLTSGRTRSRFIPASPFESLEQRMMMCMDHIIQQGPVRELRPDLVPAALTAPKTTRAGVKTGAIRTIGHGLYPASVQGGEAADIIWQNRGTKNATNDGLPDTDSFFATFGTSANLARGVVDAVINAYERMIGSFNYAVPNTDYSLSLSMSGSGFGAFAGLDASLGGKAQAGTVGMGKGNNSANANDDNGWFLDPTPEESSEFLGNIVNGFSGDAQGGSPAGSKGDFYTVVAAEMTHCMGLFGSALPGWAALTTNTGTPDKAEAGSTNTGSRGNYWVFRGPSIKHLMTGNNGGSGGSNFGSAVHSAGTSTVNQPFTFEGDTYIGAQDQGNAVYEFGRRYMINNTFALMFKDAYAYSSVDPAKFESTYSVRNSTTGVVTVRGGGGTNDDAISITRSGDTIFVSVDPTIDTPGSGALPGAGNLPAFVTEYDATTVNSIVIQAGTGNDTIVIGSGLGVAVSVDGGSGTDTLTLNGTAANETFNLSNTAASGDVTVSAISAVETLALNAGDGLDTITFDAAGTSTSAAINGAGGDDTLTVSNGNNSTLNFIGGTGFNTLNVLSGSFITPADLGAGSTIMSVNLNGATALLTSNASQHLNGLTIDGAAARLAFSTDGNRVLVTSNFAISNGGTLDLADNDAVIDYTGASPLAAIESLIFSGRGNGDWSGNGITSAAAAISIRTSLAAVEGSEYTAVSGNTVFANEPIDGTAIVIKYTWYGDTDLNGKVDGADYARVDTAFLQQSANGSIGGWINGDFNYDDEVDGADFALIDGSFLAQNSVL